MRNLTSSALLAALLFLLLVVSGVSAQEYVVRSGYDSPLPADAGARTPVPVTFWALPLWVIFAELVLLPREFLLVIKFWASLGIRQVSGANVLDQGARARIYEYIRHNPGIHLRGLSSEMQMKLGTLRYHLNILRHNHKIAVSGDNATIRFYENSGTYSCEEQHIHKHLRNETTRKILCVLLDRPQVTRQDIADAVGISGPSVSWLIKRLEMDNLVLHRHEGRIAAYEIPAAVAVYLGRQIQSPSGIPTQECPGVAGNA